MGQLRSNCAERIKLDPNGVLSHAPGSLLKYHPRRPLLALHLGAPLAGTLLCDTTSTVGATAATLQCNTTGPVCSALHTFLIYYSGENRLHSLSVT